MPASDRDNRNGSSSAPRFARGSHSTGDRGGWSQQASRPIIIAKNTSIAKNLPVKNIDSGRGKSVPSIVVKKSDHRARSLSYSPSSREESRSRSRSRNREGDRDRGRDRWGRRSHDDYRRRRSSHRDQGRSRSRERHRRRSSPVSRDRRHQRERRQSQSPRREREHASKQRTPARYSPITKDKVRSKKSTPVRQQQQTPPSSPDIRPALMELGRVHGIDTEAATTKEDIEKLMERALISVAYNRCQHDWDGQEAVLAALFTVETSASAIPFGDSSQFAHFLPSGLEPVEPIQLSDDAALQGDVDVNRLMKTFVAYELEWECQGGGPGPEDPRAQYRDVYDAASAWHNQGQSVPSFVDDHPEKRVLEKEEKDEEDAASEVSWSQSPRKAAAAKAVSSMVAPGPTAALKDKKGDVGEVDALDAPPAPIHEERFGAAPGSAYLMRSRKSMDAHVGLDLGEGDTHHPTLEEGHFQARNFDGTWRDQQEQLAKLQRSAREGGIPRWPVYRHQDALWVPMEAESLEDFAWRGSEVGTRKDSNSKESIDVNKEWRQNTKGLAVASKFSLSTGAGAHYLQERDPEVPKVASAHVESSDSELKGWKERTSNRAKIAIARQGKPKRMWGGRPPLHVVAALRGQLLGPMSWVDGPSGTPHPVARIAEELLHKAIGKIGREKGNA